MVVPSWRRTSRPSLKNTNVGTAVPGWAGPSARAVTASPAISAILASESRFWVRAPERMPARPRTLKQPRACYVCKAEYRELHFFYDALCPACGDFNYEKRFQSADLHGRVALVTGARVKIGYQAALTLLRCGATVVACTPPL